MADGYTINGKLVLDITDADTKLQKVAKETKEIEKQTAASTKKVSTDWGKVGTNLSKLGADLTKKVTLPIAAAATAAVKLASDLHETVEKSGVVFDTHAGRVD